MRQNFRVLRASKNYSEDPEEMFRLVALAWLNDDNQVQEFSTHLQDVNCPSHLIRGRYFKTIDAAFGDLDRRMRIYSLVLAVPL